MRAVDFFNIFLIKEFTAGRRARAGLLGGLKQKVYISAGIPALFYLLLQQKRRAAEGRRVAVVAAEMSRAALR